MNPQPSPVAIQNPVVTQKQRWLYWNVPGYFSAMWIRHGKIQLANQIGIVWEEVKWPADHPLEVTDAIQQLDRSSCILVGIDHSNFSQMIPNLIALKSCTEQAFTQGSSSGSTRHRSKIFLIVVCFECDAYLKSSLLELGADCVIDRIETVPAITRMIAKNGRTFSAAPHPYLPT